MDYIEREKVWSALNVACVPYNRATAKAIESIPAADVRPVVRGRWVAADFHTVKCSICDFEMDIMKVDDHILNHANYCTNCGADMRKEEP